MTIEEKEDWLKEHGNFAKVWFCTGAWMPNKKVIIFESEEEDYIEDLFKQVKQDLFGRVCIMETNNEY